MTQSSCPVLALNSSTPPVRSQQKVLFSPVSRSPCPRTPKRMQRPPAARPKKGGRTWVQEEPTAGSSCHPIGPPADRSHPYGPSALHEKKPSWDGGGGEPLGTRSAIDSRNGRLGGG